jgi:peptidoglycan/xylan/chitin deacetylase (PgdA/CDA1 family)
MIAVLLFHDVYRHDPGESGFAGRGAERYKLRLPAFEAQLARLARVRADAPACIGSDASAFRQTPGRDDPGPFALTVDDGGASFYSMVADRLEARGWRAHCFVTTGAIGRRGFLDSRQIRALHRRGHVIGSHSVTHPTRFAACRRERALREWRESRYTLSDILGEDVRVASVPGGWFAPDVARSAAEAGMTTLFTSEPVTAVSEVDGCTVIGRFTVRPRHRADFAARVASFDRWTLATEWAAWNGKKAARRVLGPLYARLAA